MRRWRRSSAGPGRHWATLQEPLLVSVRSGARVSMPGMLDTVLNLGLNDESVAGLARSTGSERFAWDSYRRFVQMFGNVVRGIPSEVFERAMQEAKDSQGVSADTELGAEELRRLTATFRRLFEEATGDAFPTQPREQLRQAITAVFDSWDGERAVAYRRINGIPDDWGTAVNVQQMVFGNRGETSGSGVAFSRDERTGEPTPSGDFLANAQGEDVVAGTRDPEDLSALAVRLPEAHAQLLRDLSQLEAHYKDIQDVEFTIEEGRLFLLQTRAAKRPAQAAVRFAVDAVAEGLLTRSEALMTIDPEALEALLHPVFDPRHDFEVLTTGRRGVARRGHGSDRAQRAGGRPSRRRRRGRDPGPHLHRGRRRRRVPRRARRPHRPGGQGLARGARRPRHGSPVRRRRLRGQGRRRGRGGANRRQGAGRRRADRDRGDHRQGHGRRGPAGRARAQRGLHRGAALVG